MSSLPDTAVDLFLLLSLSESTRGVTFEQLKAFEPGHNRLQ